MGTERESRKRRSPLISEDEGKSKKHRTKDDPERASKKRKDKERKNKSSKHSRDDVDKVFSGRESSEKHDHKHHKNSSREEIEDLSSDDYYSKNNEFSTWLKEEKGLFFSDLSSEAAHKLFSGFIKDWNSQKLKSHYYKGITSGPRSAHNWKIKHK
ncbi:splicing regulatory glutamine/lysine-rich-like protein isoform X2 [Tasmannia lanceolata]|uniref:splicing regulatory glutamine/lysine-rich-like protein isoform X2 n=1 Tax=Tasmannia lanceolata TaxID=3420 RepID=UPI004063938A